MFIFLRQYRATPHSTTGKYLSELLNGRRLKRTLPRVQYDQASLEIRQTDSKRKEKMEEYAGKCSHAKSTDLNVGERVLIKQPKKDKMSTPFKPEPQEIKDKKGSIITAQNEEHAVTRNASFFKKLPSDDHMSPIPTDNEEQVAPLVGVAEPVLSAKTVEPVEAVGSCKLPALRRSTRTRLVPEYFKDYIT